MKIFSCDQIRQIDEYTIRNEPVSSADLMERASAKIFSWITSAFSRSSRFLIFAGPGNNGGDGLVLARLLADNGYNAETFCLPGKESSDRELNRRRLKAHHGALISPVESEEDIPDITSEDIVIDAIFGSGLKRPVTGLIRSVIEKINNSSATTVSVDIPSGLFCEDNSGNDDHAVIRASYTLSFQFPKLSFMFADNAPFTGEFTILPIGLHEAAVRNTSSPFRYVEGRDILPMLRERHRFDHKGNFGHGLLVTGSFGKMGAAVLCSGAALRTGIGLVTCHVPECGYQVLQTAVPEAMVLADASDKIVSSVGSPEHFNAVGIGPGLGTDNKTQKAFHEILLGCRKPLVIDADGLNILSLNREWLGILPESTILTPHPKEFGRLAGTSEDGYQRLMKQVEFSKEYKCIVVLKGANTSVSMPDGRVFFNSTGNPGMATGGSGDVLTGMLMSLLAQGYEPENAAVAGVYLHGMAGDIAAELSSEEAIIASDIINCIGKAFKRIRETN